MFSSTNEGNSLWVSPSIFSEETDDVPNSHFNAPRHGFLTDVYCKEGKWYARIKVVTRFDAGQPCVNVWLNCLVNQTDLQASIQQLRNHINELLFILVDFGMSYCDVEACYSGMTISYLTYMVHISGENQSN